MDWISAAFMALTAMCLGPTTSAPTIVQSLDVNAPFLPVLADSGGDRQLVYELHLTNFSSRPILIEQVSVVSAANGLQLAEAEGETLRTWMGPATSRGGAVHQTIDPGMRALIYFNLPVEDTRVPAAIRHRIVFRFSEGEDRAPKQLLTGQIPVDSQPLPRLGPPLRGGPWVAVYAPEMERGHRRVVYATGGAARIPGRFAIDWIRLDDSGQKAAPDATKFDQFHGYGAEVLAVADATVVAVRNDMGEPETLADIAPVSIGDASGNYIALDIGDGRFAFYEHLQPGIQVRRGQRVRRGDVIGRLGLTGQGSGPHLHFHLASANSVLDAEGLPYLLEGYRQLGSYDSFEDYRRGGAWRSKAAAPTGAFPPPNVVVQFTG